MTDLVITRIFDAPRPMVYRAFMDPDQMAAWFGPVGWSVPRDSMIIEPKPGGVQSFTMINDSDPSQTSPVSAVFTEVVENELIVGEEQASGMRLRLEFSDDAPGTTRLVLTQGPFAPEWHEGAREGWGSSFTKLDALLSA